MASGSLAMALHSQSLAPPQQSALDQLQYMKQAASTRASTAQHLASLEPVLVMSERLLCILHEPVCRWAWLTVLLSS